MVSEACPACKQHNVGQAGEYPCGKCGLPTTWDNEIVCTWKGCTNPAAIPQLSEHGETWAKLCVDHDTELDQAIKSGSPKAVLSSWIKAHGGAEAMR